jgi:hypothetical protein
VGSLIASDCETTLGPLAPLALLPDVATKQFSSKRLEDKAELQISTVVGFGCPVSQAFGYTESLFQLVDRFGDRHHNTEDHRDRT